MKKWQILLIIMITTISTATALEECTRVEEPRDVPCQITTTWVYPNACNTYTSVVYNNTGENFINYTMDTFGIYCNVTWNISDEGSYYYNISSGDSGLIIIEKEKDEMATLAVTLLIMSITIGVFALPKIVKRFSENEILNTTLKGLCIVFGLLLLSLSVVMVVTMADEADLGVSQELFRYLWIVNWATYLTMMIVVLSFGLKVLQLWTAKKKREGYGEM